jgi:5-methylcytosine-specific restriction protein A
MPYKPKKPCSHPGCPKLTDGRFCEAHAKQDAREYEKYRRDPDTRKRYGRAWKRIRDRYIAAHPLCEQCERNGRLTPAQEVHHIKPLAAGGTHDAVNLMALCSSCHSGITLGENNRRRG